MPCGMLILYGRIDVPISCRPSTQHGMREPNHQNAGTCPCWDVCMCACLCVWRELMSCMWNILLFTHRSTLLLSLLTISRKKLQGGQLSCCQSSCTAATLVETSPRNGRRLRAGVYSWQAYLETWIHNSQTSTLFAALIWYCLLPGGE